MRKFRRLLISLGLVLGLGTAIAVADDPNQYPYLFNFAHLWTALQTFNNAVIVGGTIDNTPVGNTTPAAGSFSTLNEPVGQALTFGGSSYPGGRVASLTGTGAGSLLFGNALTVIDFGGSQQYKFSTAGLFASLPIRFATSTSLTAVGTTQATALALTADNNIVTTTASGTGVVLAAYNSTYSGAVARQEVTNVGANTLAVYPPSGAAIWVLNGSTASLAANAAASLATGSHGTFECVSATQCYEAP